MNTFLRNLSIVAAGAAAGFLSGALEPAVYGVRGAILGAALAAGTLFLNSGRPPNSGSTGGKNLRQLFLTAVPAALGAFLLIVLADRLLPVRPGRDEILDTAFKPLPVFATCLLLSAALLRGCQLRRAGANPKWHWFVYAPAAAALVRTIGYREMIAFPFCLLVGAYPFVVFWLLAVGLVEAAWNRQRRQPPPGVGCGAA